MVDLLFIVIELLRCILWLRRYKRKSVEVGVFRRGWVSFGEYFGWKRTISSKCRRSGKARDSYGVEILIDNYFVCVTIHASDRRTELRQQYRALHYMQSHDKNRHWVLWRLFKYRILLNNKYGALVWTAVLLRICSFLEHTMFLFYMLLNEKPTFHFAVQRNWLID